MDIDDDFEVGFLTGEMSNPITHHRSAPPSPTGHANMNNEFHTSHSTDEAFIIVPNDVEAHRITNNYLFGFKKWKSHISTRPVENRSEIVRDLYSDVNKPSLPVRVSTLRPTNVIYVFFIGWWLSLVYVLASIVMFLTYFGRSYGFFCMKMARYFLWPFGYFVHLVDTPPPLEHSDEVCEITASQNSQTYEESDERTSLLSNSFSAQQLSRERWRYWTKPKTYLWLIIAVPVLFVCHSLVVIVTWLLVVTIPIAKINIKTIQKLFFLPPEQVDVCNSNVMPTNTKKQNGEIIMYTHQSVNIYYYKYAVDGMNVILVNLLLFVIAALVLGLADTEERISPVMKCLMALFGIVPLTYYIGAGITSISAQSSFAVGALLNATFGSIVEVILYVITLKKGQEQNSACYPELVKSAVAGTILATMLLIPGLCMVIGGLKYQTQRFNPRSTSVGASLLFVSVAGVFAPTLFSAIYGDLHCSKCEKVESWISINSTETMTNNSVGMQCSECSQSLFGLDGDTTLYDNHILPLVYTCALLLPISYFIGLIFSMKTHFGHVYHDFYNSMAEEGSSHRSHQHGSPQWSRLKCIFILFASTALISLLADIMANNIQPLMKSLKISEYFIGVTLIAVLPELPEIVNGIQFALQNNVAMGIEIAMNTAIQCCLLQVPILILIDLIYDFKLYMIFNDVHMFSVIFSVIVMNYTLQDGRSNYFQGSALLLIYLVLMAMYFFTPTPKLVQC
ncbi:low affinity vacuolar monovalent cation/H(+) antiporter-like [Argonauta hians]